MSDILIVGGGLAGLVSSILLSREGYDVILIEKKTYPSHKVCGEYVSNEVIPFLEAHDLFPSELEPSKIEKFWLTSTSGKMAKMELDLGAFGISRYRFDEYLHNQAIASGVLVILGESVDQIDFDGSRFTVQTSKHNQFESKLVLGAHGKRSNLDKALNRDFIAQKSPYIGVKYHLKIDMPQDVIALHNFEKGYCGISKVENGKYNLCYLSHRDNLKAHGNIPAMEKAILYKNPYLKKIFEEGEFLFEKPEVINEISFEPKPPVENHVIMIGDSAGMITPLCGNGMAMAIHSAKIVSEIIVRHWPDDSPNLEEIEKEYIETWNREFASRLKAGRFIQNLFGSTRMSNLAVFLAKFIKPLASFAMRKTHGQPF